MRLEDLPSKIRSTALTQNGLTKKKLKKAAKPSAAEELLQFQLIANGLRHFVREYRFATELGRQWRFDFAHIPTKLAIEVEGLRVKKTGNQWVCTGRHTTPGGYREDCIKYNTAALLGWTVLRFDQTQIKSGEAINMIFELCRLRGWKHG